MTSLHGIVRSWQPDSYGTGGILANDYRTIQWFKISALTGGTSYMSTGLGLRPWYLQGFDPVQPISSVAPAPIDSAPEGALQPVAEAPSCESSSNFTSRASCCRACDALPWCWGCHSVHSLRKHPGASAHAATSGVAPARGNAAPEIALSPAARPRACDLPHS